MSAPALVGGDGEALAVAQEVVTTWDDAGLGGAFLARHLGTGAEIGFDVDRPLPLASLVKLPLALAVLDAAGRGDLGPAGEALPVDARPAPVVLDGGVKLGNRRQPFDATFGLEKTDAVTFHRNGVPTTVPSSAGIPVFDDSDENRYWDAKNPWSSVKVAGSGTVMKVNKSSADGNQLQVQVSFK